MISSKYRFIYLHPPKTAGNAIQQALLPFSDDRMTIIGHQDGLNRFGIVGEITDKKHTSLQHYYDRLQTELADYMVVISVRDPVERALSHYFGPASWQEKTSDATYSQVESYWDLDRFKEQVSKMRTYEDMLIVGGSVRMPDLVVRYESLMDDFDKVCDHLGLPIDHKALKWVNASTDSGNLRAGLRQDSRVLSVVNEKFKADRFLFGY